MTMLLRITTLEEVAEQFRSEYVQDGDGFRLDIEGEHAGEVAMRRARDNEKNEHRKTKARIAELEAELDAMREQSSSGQTTIEANNKSWQTKFDAKVAEYEAAIAALNTSLSATTSGARAKELAAKLFVVPAANVHLVESRLKTEIVDGEPVVRVLNDKGEDSGMTLDDLEREFRAKKDWAPIIKAPSGSGSGQPPSGGKPPASDKVYTRANAHEMPESERRELLKNDPDKFTELFKKA